MYPIAGTKERRSGRRALTFTIANHGPVIVDGIRPEDRDAAFDLLWARYGRGNVWVSYRRMARGEQYRAIAQIDGQEAA